MSGTVRSSGFKSLEEFLRFGNFELLPILRQLRQAVVAPISEGMSVSSTADIASSLILVDATAGPVTVTLADGRKALVRVVKVDASGNAVTVTPVQGGATLAAQWDSVDVIGDGTLFYK
jgi:S1-C subfamily serine protease